MAEAEHIRKKPCLQPRTGGSLLLKRELWLKTKPPFLYCLYQRQEKGLTLVFFVFRGFSTNNVKGEKALTLKAVVMMLKINFLCFSLIGKLQRILEIWPDFFIIKVES